MSGRTAYVIHTNVAPDAIARDLAYHGHVTHVLQSEWSHPARGSRSVNQLARVRVVIRRVSQDEPWTYRLAYAFELPALIGDADVIWYVSKDHDTHDSALAALETLKRVIEDLTS